MLAMTAPAARSVLRKRIREIAQSRVRYGCQRIFTLLRREGCGRRAGGIITSECIAYIGWKGLTYAASDLAVIEQRLIGWTARHSLTLVSAGTVRRSGMDFVADQLFDGRKIRALTVPGRRGGG